MNKDNAHPIINVITLPKLSLSKPPTKFGLKWSNILKLLHIYRCCIWVMSGSTTWCQVSKGTFKSISKSLTKFLSSYHTETIFKRNLPLFMSYPENKVEVNRWKHSRVDTQTVSVTGGTGWLNLVPVWEEPSSDFFPPIIPQLWLFLKCIFRCSYLWHTGYKLLYTSWWIFRITPSHKWQLGYR